MNNDSVILDVTTVLTLISDTTHKPKELITPFETALKSGVNKYRQKIEAIHREMIDEVENPLYPKLKKVLDGKQFLMVQESMDRLESDMLPIMNECELGRYKNLMKNVKKINTDISDRFMEINNNRWKSSNRAVFGTADKLKVKLLTGNKKAAYQVLTTFNWDMDIQIHRSRDLVGTRLLRNVGLLDYF